MNAIKAKIAWHGKRNSIAIQKMGEWIIKKGLATDEELVEIKKEALTHVRKEQKEAWAAFLNTIKQEQKEVLELVDAIAAASQHSQQIQDIAGDLRASREPIRKRSHKHCKKNVEVQSR